VKISIQFKNSNNPHVIDFSNGISLTQKISRTPENNVNAYFIPPAKFIPFKIGDFIGSVAQGGACNCEDITFNAHGNGTHTECVGHIAKEAVYITDIHVPILCKALLIDVKPKQQQNGDFIIDATSYHWEKLEQAEAIIIRSGLIEPKMQFSGTNPCYFHPNIAQLLREKGFNHLITDLPSVDREEDGGLLAAHKAFFNYPQEISKTKTISELAYIPAFVNEGVYLLHFGISAIESDAVPSMLTIFAL